MKANLKIKILYIVNHAVPYGANVALLNLLDSIINRGVIPYIIIGEYGVLCEELKKRNISYSIIRHYFVVYPKLNSIKNVVFFIPKICRTILINFIAEKKLIKIIKRFNPNIIHTNIGPSHIGYSAAKKCKIPHIWHIREYQDLDFNMVPFPSKKSFIRKLNSNNNFSIAITNGVFNHFKMGNNARVIYDGVMPAKQTQFIENKEKYFLFVGRLEETKGIHNLIKAFIEFSNLPISNDYKLLIAGNGDSVFTNQLEKVIKQARLQEKIILLGFRKDVYSLMARATALIVPSNCEGFGFITVEAMFNGCLVIGNNNGGTKEILEKEKLGILYIGHKELVESLMQVVIRGVKSYFPIMYKAQNIASNHYSQEMNSTKIYNFYKHILEK